MINNCNKLFVLLQMIGIKPIIKKLKFERNFILKLRLNQIKIKLWLFWGS